MRRTKILSVELGAYNPLQTAVDDATREGWEIIHISTSPTHVSTGSDYGTVGRSWLTIILQRDE